MDHCKRHVCTVGDVENFDHYITYFFLLRIHGRNCPLVSAVLLTFIFKILWIIELIVFYLWHGLKYKFKLTSLNINFWLIVIKCMGHYSMLITLMAILFFKKIYFPFTLVLFFKLLIPPLPPFLFFSFYFCHAKCFVIFFQKDIWKVICLTCKYLNAYFITTELCDKEIYSMPWTHKTLLEWSSQIMITSISIALRAWYIYNTLLAVSGLES